MRSAGLSFLPDKTSLLLISLTQCHHLSCFSISHNGSFVLIQVQSRMFNPWGSVASHVPLSLARPCSGGQEVLEGKSCAELRQEEGGVGRGEEKVELLGTDPRRLTRSGCGPHLCRCGPLPPGSPPPAHIPVPIGTPSRFLVFRAPSPSSPNPNSCPHPSPLDSFSGCRYLPEVLVESDCGVTEGGISI